MSSVFITCIAGQGSGYRVYSTYHTRALHRFPLFQMFHWEIKPIM